MADQNPGQIITPGGQPENQNQPTQEVQVSLQQPPQQPLSNVQSAPSQPQPVQQPLSPTPSSPPQPDALNPNPPVPSLPSAQVAPPATPLQTTPVAQSIPEQPVEQGFASGFTSSELPHENTYDQMVPDQTFASTSDSDDVINWTASEYIAHQKSPAWFLALGVGAVIVAVAVYLITSGDIFAVVVILFVAVIFAVYAAKKPKEQTYSISPGGIVVGARMYTFDQFKAFSIIDEGVFSSIMFLPMKRFMPAISIYYDPQDEERIVQTLSDYLPVDAQKRDAVDALMRKIRF